MNKILNEQGEHQLQIAFYRKVVIVQCLKALHQSGDVRQLMLDEEKMRMFEVFDDQIDRVRNEGKVGLLQMARRFKLPDHLFSFQPFCLANLVEGELRILVEADAEVKKNIGMDVVLINQFSNARIF